MRWSDLTPGEAARRLRREGLRWDIGAVALQVRSDAPGLAEALRHLYADYPLQLPPWNAPPLCHLTLRQDGGWRRWLRPRVHFALDGPSPFHPFPLDHALPLFEWGFNFTIASRAHHFLILHAAVLERGGKALLLPGEPGSGKSTLAAALALSSGGWRLLSDEFGLLRPETGLLHPAVRPIALKNASIGVLRAFAPTATLGPEYPKTRKGVVAHLRPPTNAVDRRHEAAPPAWIVLPQFIPDAPLTWIPLSPEERLLRLGGNAYNYELQGERGFRAVAALARARPGWILRYGHLEEAVAALDAVEQREWER
ncbi:MAG: HprK-related kinase A [Magnetococcales bacterium]|nr:HprK-related kinase A [Magnetococcales bacterium]